MQKRGEMVFSKRGQLTIFIIIGIVIIAVAVLIYFIVPKTQTGAVFDSKNPNGFIQNCLEKTIQDSVEKISLQGGSADPEFYDMYQGQRVEYLCYTAENYATCVVQRPLLQEHFETEVEKDISTEVQSCFNSLMENYQNEGYMTNLEKGKTLVFLLPNKVLVNFSGYVLNVSKTETSRYNSFSVVLNNNLYELVNIATSIIDWESRFGDSSPNIYMTYYKNVKVEKMIQSDGTKIYILTDRNSGIKFQFASRSVVFPPGIGLQGVSTT